MFGFSFGELLVISLVTLVAVGPQKLPGMLKTMGQWARKLRKMTMDVRRETGIDEMLRAEGIQISELRSLMRGYHPTAGAAPSPAPTPSASPSPSPRYDDPYAGFEPDPTREYPPEGADAYGALPDDLLEPPTSNEVADAPGAPEPKPEPVVEAPPAPAPEPVIAAAPEAEPAVVAAAVVAAPVVAPPVVAPPAPVVAVPVVAAPVVAAPVVAAPSAPAAAPPRSAPPPPPSRTGLAPPRPSGAPPPPPRRTAPPPPRPDSSAPVKADAPAVPPSPGTPNGNG